MLMEAGTLAVVDKIVLHHDSCRALIWIESPTAVAIGIDVMDTVVAHLRAF